MMLFRVDILTCSSVVIPTSFPGSLSPRPQEREKRDPGTGWSRVSQNLGDDNKIVRGRGGSECILSILSGERKVLHDQAYFYSDLSRDNVSIRLAFYA